MGALLLDHTNPDDTSPPTRILRDVASWLSAGLNSEHRVQVRPSNEGSGVYVLVQRWESDGLNVRATIEADGLLPVAGRVNATLRDGSPTEAGLSNVGPDGSVLAAMAHALLTR